MPEEDEKLDGGEAGRAELDDTRLLTEKIVAAAGPAQQVGAAAA